MAYRATMAALIARVRLLINDTASTTQVFEDTDIQDVLDESRLDVYNQALMPEATYTGGLIQYLDYFSELGGWEDGSVFKQYLTQPVTPSLSEPIAGHWQFATTTLPPVYITGKVYDVYRASADLLERMASRWTLSYDFTSDGQSFRRSQAVPNILSLVKQYRMKQRPTVVTMKRSDINGSSLDTPSLAPTPFDYMDVSGG